jgi:hypothetical protein
VLVERLLPTPFTQTSVFWNVDGVPVSAVETPDGGLRLGAFDMPAGRPISLALVLKDGVQIKEAEFERLKPTPARSASLEPKKVSPSRPSVDPMQESLRAATQKRWAAAMAFRIQPSTAKPAPPAPEKSSGSSPSVAEIAAAIAKVRSDEAKDARKLRDPEPDAKPERK